MKHRRLIATIAFVTALVLGGAEIFLLISAKDRHDYARAQEQSEAISVELGLITASFNSGNKTLYREGTTRLNQTLSEYRQNDYIRNHRTDVLQALNQYEDALARNAEKIDTLLELRAALAAVSSELYNIGDNIDAKSFYNVSHAFEDLGLALEKIELEDFKEVREALGDFAKDAQGIVDAAATCVSVCPDSVFDDKIAELNGLKEKYGERFESLGLDFSKELSTSELITTLRGI